MILEPHGSPRTFPRTTKIVGSDSTTGLPTHGTHGKSHTGVAHWLYAMWSHVRLWPLSAYADSIDLV